MKLDGHVIKLNYRYPHSELLIETDDGQTWVVSLAPPDVSDKQGKKAALIAIEAGEAISVYGWPHKMKSNEIRSHKLLLSDDRVIDGAVNSLYEPRVQKNLKRVLANPERLTELESEQDGQASDDPFVRLVLDIHHDRAAFIGFSVDGQTVYPGIKEHLLCFPSRFPQHVRETEGMDVADEEFVNNYNEWLARYLEGQLNICKDLQ